MCIRDRCWVCLGVGGVAGQGVDGAAPIGDEQLGGYDQRMRIEELRQLNQLELQRGEIQQGNYLREKSLLERQEAAEEKKYARVDQEEDRLRRLADIENQTQEQAHERAMQQDRERDRAQLVSDARGDERKQRAIERRAEIEAAAAEENHRR